MNKIIILIKEKPIVVLKTLFSLYGIGVLLLILGGDCAMLSLIPFTIAIIIGLVFMILYFIKK